MERKNGNWTIKGTEKKFGNDFFKVFEDKVIQPDGKDGNYATIKFVSGVSVLPIDDDDFVYLTKQFRYSAGRETLEVVAGGIENENPLDAAKREVKEELDYSKSRLTRYDTDKVAFDSNIVTLRSTYQFTRFIFARTRIDYSSLRSNLSGQLLLGWNPSPGTAFYIGYNDNLNYNGFNRFSGQFEPNFQRNGLERGNNSRAELCFAAESVVEKK